MTEKNIEPMSNNILLSVVLLGILTTLFFIFYMVSKIELSLALILYIISFLDSLTYILAFFTLTCVVGIIMMILYALIEHGLPPKDFYNRNVKIIWCLLTLMVFSMVSNAMIPNKNDMYLIASVHVGEKLIKSEKVNELLDKSYTVLVGKLDNIIKDNETRKNTDNKSTSLSEEK